jgi:parvulin-like peptidyl-prolyl isomerase
MSLVNLKKKMQKGLAPFLYVFVAMFVGSIFFFMNPGGGGAQDGGPAGGVFAKLGDNTISQMQFKSLLDRNQEFMLQLAQMGQPVTAETQARIPGQAYRQILNEFAAAAAAEQHGVRVSTSEAEADARAQIEERVKQLGEGSTPAEIANIRSILLSNIDGAAERRRLLAQKLQEKLTQDTKPVEVKVAHVLIKTEKRSDAEALKLAQDIARQAKAGGDFAKLAEKHSEDEGSKKQGGVAGWASAQPGPSGAKEAAASFVQEFTAASLALQKGQISDPVRTNFGYHVIKALETRDFQPKPEPPAKPDPKSKKKPDEIAKEAADKKQQAIDSYKSQAASTIAQGLVAEQTRRLEGQLKAESPWLKGFLLDEKANKADLPQVIEFYTLALKNNDPAAGQGLAYTVVKKHMDYAKELEGKNQKPLAQAQYKAALEVLDRWARTDTDLLTLAGDVHQKLGDKTKALASYQEALERARRNQTALLTLEGKFKELGRKDLAAKTAARMAEVLAEQEKQRQEQQAAQAKALAATATAKTADGTPVKIKVGGPKPEGVAEAEKKDAAPKAQ